MHYSHAQKPYLLKSWANTEAERLINLNYSSIVLVYSGMSGISAATALSLALYERSKDHSMVYIRKEFETTHGESVECESFYNLENATFFFVDDFIQSGATRDFCLDKLNDHRFGYNYQPVKFTDNILQVR